MISLQETCPTFQDLPPNGPLSNNRRIGHIHHFFLLRPSSAFAQGPNWQYPFYSAEFPVQRIQPSLSSYLESPPSSHQKRCHLFRILFHLPVPQSSSPSSPYGGTIWSLSGGAAFPLTFATLVRAFFFSFFEILPTPLDLLVLPSQSPFCFSLSAPIPFYWHLPCWFFMKPPTSSQNL